MRNKIPYLLLALLALVLPSCFGGGRMTVPTTQLGVVVAHEGKTDTAIVIGPAAGEATKLLAEDVRAYVKQMTGVDVEIVTPDGLREEHKCTIALGIPEIQTVFEEAVGKLVPEEYALKSCSYKERQSLAVLGGDELGLQYGGYAMLELLMGVKFFHPQHEFVPKKDSLFIGRRIYWQEKPRFALRGMVPRVDCKGSEFESIFGKAENLPFARRYVDYLVKNRQNVLALPLTAAPSNVPAHYAQIFAYAHTRGLKVMLCCGADALSAENLKALCKLGADIVEIDATDAKAKSQEIAAAQKIAQECGAKIFLRDPDTSQIPSGTGVSVGVGACRDILSPGGARGKYDALRGFARKYPTLCHTEIACAGGYDPLMTPPNPLAVKTRGDDGVRLMLCGAAGAVHDTRGLEWLAWLNDYAAMRYNWDPERWNMRAVLRDYALIFGAKAQPAVERALLRAILTLERLHAADCLEDFLAFRRDSYKPADGAKMRLPAALTASVDSIAEELGEVMEELAMCAPVVEPAAQAWFDELDDCTRMLHDYAGFEALALAAKSPENEKLLQSLDARMKHTAESRRAQYRYPQ